MRFMVLIKANADTEAGRMPSEQLLAEMGRFNEALVRAGVMQAGEGLHPSARGARVLFDGERRTVIDGPFAETKELIAGFWIWQVGSRAEALEWARRIPNPTGVQGEVELRQVFEAEDFGEAFTPELRAQEDRQRAALAAKGAAKAVVTNPVPPARGATPYLVVRGAGDAIAWYQRALGATLGARLDAPDGSVVHAELAVGEAQFMLSEERPEYGSKSPRTLGGTPVTLVVYVPDADAAFATATAAGASAVMPVADQFWGDRAGCFTDPFGHAWFVNTRREEVSAEEMKRRMQAMFAPPGMGAG